MKAEFISSKVIAKNIKRYDFKPEKKISQTAGQYVEITLRHKNPDDRGEQRWFTLSSSPTAKYLAITTKQIADKASSFKQALDHLKPGETVNISDPMGDFVLPADESIPLVFVAGGIGITPFLSIIEYLRATQQKRQIALLYAVSSKDEAVDLGKYKQVIQHNQLVLGRLNGQLIYDQANKLDNPLIYVSGPENMVEALTKELEQMGVKKAKIVGDFFPGYD